MIRTLAVLCGVSLLGTTARADADRQHQQEVDAFKRGLPQVAPAPGRDKATARPAPWCAGVTIDEGAYLMSAIGRSIGSFERGGWEALAKAAEITCSFQKEPAVNQAVAVIEQLWINYTGLSETDAVASLTARIHGDAFKAAKDSLCNALTVSSEWDGEEKVFMVARRELFGCKQERWGEKEALWIDPAARLDGEVMHYVDLSSTPVDELVRVATIVDGTYYTVRTGKPSDGLDAARYILGAYDFKALSTQALMQQLETAPYKGNVYARTVALESLARARRGISASEAEAGKLATSDPDWKELLVTAPARGLAEYTSLADKYRSELDRSNAFEHTFFGPSRKAVKGCYAPLRTDFLAIAKTLPQTSDVAFWEGLSTHPIASVLFTRLAACASMDGQEALGHVLLSRLDKLRASRGPRMAIYYTAFDALTKIVADRPKFPVAVGHLGKIHISKQLRTEAAKAALADQDSFSSDKKQKGIVKSVKKTSGGLELTFVKDKHQETVYDCTATNRIISFQPDGTPNYYQSCNNPSLRTVDDTSDPITVPAAWAGGIAAGAALEFMVTSAKAPGRIALPTAVFKDKSRKQLVNFYGFGL